MLFGVIATGADQPGLVGHAGPRGGDGEHLSAQRRRPAGAEWRAALAAPVGPRADPAGRGDHPRQPGRTARQAVDRDAGQRVPPRRRRQAAGPGRGHPRHARQGQLDSRQCPHDQSRSVAGSAGGNEPADGPDGFPRAGKLRLARHAVGLGAARVSSPCSTGPGFSSIRHRLHFQALLALPLLCATMAWSPPVSPCAPPAAAAWRK